MPAWRTIAPGLHKKASCPFGRGSARAEEGDVPWTANDIPPQAGKTIVITGANSGIGYEAALQLAGKGAHVILACRDRARGQAAIDAIKLAHPVAILSLLELDLASLASIRRFADALRATTPVLDVLCNNAGVMAIPFRRTADGFEMQFGTNHLGHFALTGLLLEPLLAAPAGRVVNVSSNGHKLGWIRFETLNEESSYSRWPAYTRSKLANLLFTYELQRRLEGAGARLSSVACHPGYSATNLQTAGAKMGGSSIEEAIMDFATRLFAQPASMGALPTLYAATAPEVRGGDYIGPDGFAEQAGHPKKVQSNARSHDPEAQHRLWQTSEELTGVRYEALAARAMGATA
jgi:NAD(P)-dependent dehydrogenase (short-subunit alcohol dehydrogenase family)